MVHTHFWTWAYHSLGFQHGILVIAGPVLILCIYYLYLPSLPPVPTLYPLHISDRTYRFVFTTAQVQGRQGDQSQRNESEMSEHDQLSTDLRSVVLDNTVAAIATRLNFSNRLNSFLTSSSRRQSIRTLKRFAWQVLCDDGIVHCSSEEVEI